MESLYLESSCSDHELSRCRLSSSVDSSSTPAKDSGCSRRNDLAISHDHLDSRRSSFQGVPSSLSTGTAGRTPSTTNNADSGVADVRSRRRELLPAT